MRVPFFVGLPVGRENPAPEKSSFCWRGKNPIRFSLVVLFLLLAAALIRSWIIYYSLSVRWRTSLDYRPSRGHCPCPSSCSGGLVLCSMDRKRQWRWWRRNICGVEREGGREEKSANAQWIHVKSGRRNKKTLNGMEPLLQCVKDKESFRLRCCIKPWV